MAFPKKHQSAMVGLILATFVPAVLCTKAAPVAPTEAELRAKREGELQKVAKWCTSKIATEVIEATSEIKSTSATVGCKGRHSALEGDCVLTLKSFSAQGDTSQGQGQEASVQLACTELTHTLPRYEEFLIIDSVVWPFVQAFCEGSGKTLVKTRTAIVSTVKELSTNPLSLKLPFMPQHFAKFAVQQVGDFLKNKCQSVLNKDKNLKVECGDPTKTSVTCPKNQKKMLLADGVATAYEIETKQEQPATRSLETLKALLCGLAGSRVVLVDALTKAIVDGASKVIVRPEDLVHNW